MKYTLLMAAAILTGTLSASAASLPGSPQANGLTPTTATRYINGTNAVNDTSGIYNPKSINNTNTEALGVGITSSGNVLVAWEDDGDEVFTWDRVVRNLQGAWTMFNAAGNSITPQTVIYSEYFDDGSGTNSLFTNSFLGMFRTNDNAYPYRAILPAAAWGPKVHANLFGPGIGMGASGGLLPYESDVFLSYFGYGEIPYVQLLDNAGQPGECLAGVALPYAKLDNAAGADIRIGDWEYLGNGNLVVVGESRQDANLTNQYGGPVTGHHAVFRIITSAGLEVRTGTSPCNNCAAALVSGESLVSSTNGPSSIWHGVGAAKDGFAVRFSDDTSGTCVRMFNNDGTATTANLVLATLTGHAEAGGGGRGDSAGFHGNGKEAYVHAASYGNGFWVTVLNTNGTVRWSRDVSDDLTLVSGSAGRGDAGITESGEVVVVYNAVPAAGLNSVAMGRLFDAAGNPKGGTFYVSEKEVPDLGSPPAAAANPRVACRNGTVAIVWESRNYTYLPGVDVIAQRYFAIPPALSVARSGAAVTLSWPTDLTGYTLQSSASLAPASWATVPGVANNSLTTNNPPGAVFYRLKR